MFEKVMKKMINLLSLTFFNLFMFTLGIMTASIIFNINEGQKNVSIFEECKSGKEKLTPLISAIINYYDDNKKYPNEIDELIPIYLNSVPKLPKHWHSLTYKVNNDKHIQPYELKAEFVRGSLSSDIYLYYIEDLSKFSPTDSLIWNTYNYKIILNNNWACCW